jgi:hypothetical protein
VFDGVADAFCVPNTDIRLSGRLRSLRTYFSYTLRAVGRSVRQQWVGNLT